MDCRLGVVVVAYGSNEVLPGCFAALRISVEEAGLTLSDATRVIVVDNSPDDPVYVPNGVPWSHSVVVPEGNLGFSPAVNLALSHIEDVDYVLLLNPDARPEPDSIRSMLTTALERDAALVGPLLVDGDGRPHGASERPFHSFRRELRTQLQGAADEPPPWGDRAWQTGEARCLTGACLLADRDFLTAVGGLETSVRMYLEDVLLCWQAHRSGRPVLLAREARCLHALGGSAGGDNFHSSLGLYLTLLGARVAFIRSTSGPALAAATRATMAFGAMLRLCRGDARYKRRQLAVLWWAVTSGQAPPWRDGPRPDLPRRLSIAA